jgi:hypothetical protein
LVTARAAGIRLALRKIEDHRVFDRDSSEALAGTFSLRSRGWQAGRQQKHRSEKRLSGYFHAPSHKGSLPRKISRCHVREWESLDEIFLISAWHGHEPPSDS